MNITEVVDLFEEIARLYPSRRLKCDKATVRAWHKIFGGYEKDRVYCNLYRHAEESPYPPAIADLTGRSSKNEDNGDPFAGAPLL